MDGEIRGLVILARLSVRNPRALGKPWSVVHSHSSNIPDTPNTLLGRNRRWMDGRDLRKRVA